LGPAQRVGVGFRSERLAIRGHGKLDTELEYLLKTAKRTGGGTKSGGQVSGCTKSGEDKTNRSKR